jgi:hypothetical protein
MVILLRAWPSLVGCAPGGKKKISIAALWMLIDKMGEDGN